MVTDRWRSERVRHLVAARSLADRAGATLESVTVEQAAPLGATDVTERVEEAVRQTAERRDVDGEVAPFEVHGSLISVRTPGGVARRLSDRSMENDWSDRGWREISTRRV